MKSIQLNLLQKYGVNGDNVGWIVLNDFLNSIPNAIPFSVIPAKAGTQGRDDPVDCVSPSFSAVFPCALLWVPAFAGMTKERMRREV
jgi:hypothetical protein